MKRCAECNKYNLFESQGRTDKINFLITKGYKKSTLDRLCIDCINREYKKVKDQESTLQAFKVLLDAEEKRNPDLYNKYTKEDVEAATKLMFDEASKIYINKYF